MPQATMNGIYGCSSKTEPQSTFLLGRVQYNIRVNFPSEKKKKKKRLPQIQETKVHLNSFMNERVVLSVLLSLRGSQEKQDSYFPSESL